MSEPKAKFRVKKGDLEIEYEGEPKEVDSRFQEIFEWVKAEGMPFKSIQKNEAYKKERQQEELEITNEEKEKVERRGGKRQAKYSA